MRLKTRTAMKKFGVFAVGFYLGVLQVALFFTMQLHLTAAYMGYFVIVLAWIIGVMISLHTKKFSESSLILVSLLSYAFYFVTLKAFPPSSVLLFFSLFFVVLCALSAGRLFTVMKTGMGSDQLFLWENTGFVLGFVLSSILIVNYAERFLMTGPAVLALGAWFVMSRVETAASAVEPQKTVVDPKEAKKARKKKARKARKMLGLSGVEMAATVVEPQQAKTAKAMPWRTRAVLFLSGINILLLQFFIVREFSVALAASELTILIVAATYFSGFSIGYFLSRKLSEKTLKSVALLSFVFHILLIVTGRFWVGYMIANGFALTAFIFVLIGVSLLSSGFYSILLPRLIVDEEAEGLEKCYATELLGAITGSLLLLLVASHSPNFVVPFYFFVMLAIVLLLLGQSRLTVPFGVMASAFLLFFVLHQETISRAVTSDFYRWAGYNYPVVKFSGQSFYHSLDVLETHAQQNDLVANRRIALINGVKYFEARYDQKGLLITDSSSLGEFTYFLAELPAKYVSRVLQKKLNVLILGGGSLTTMARVAPYAQKTTLVEIDSLVVTVAQQHWRELNHYGELPNATIVIDDAKHFLKTTQEKYDLVVLDVSAPYYLATALIHSKEFFALAATVLAPQGVFSESTQARPINTKTEETAMKILKGVTSVFPKWRLIDTHEIPRGKQGYVYASFDFPFDTPQLTDLLKADNKYNGTSTYTETTDHFQLQDVEPYSSLGMGSLLKRNYWRIQSQLIAHVHSPKSLTFSQLYAFLKSHSERRATMIGLVVALALVLLWEGLRLIIRNYTFTKEKKRCAEKKDTTKPLPSSPPYRC
jgi:spermidine synthase/uncharacterized protein YneF (UPF0154 family)